VTRRVPLRVILVSKRVNNSVQNGQGRPRRQRLCRRREYVRQEGSAAARGTHLLWRPDVPAIDSLLLYSGTSTRIIRRCPFARSPA
jgi:hypothetical protein